MPTVEWMMRTHLDQVAAVERSLNTGVPWIPAEFRHCLNRHRCTGLVALDGDDVVGFTLYERRETHLMALRIEATSQAAADTLVETLTRKVVAQDRAMLAAFVRLSDLRVLNTLKRHEATATTVVSEMFGPQEDGVCVEWRPDTDYATDSMIEWVPVNQWENVPVRKNN